MKKSFLSLVLALTILIGSVGNVSAKIALPTKLVVDGKEVKGYDTFNAIINNPKVYFIGEKNDRKILNIGNKEVANFNGMYEVSDDGKNYYYTNTENGKTTLNINGKKVATIGNYLNLSVSRDFTEWYYSYEKNGKSILNINGKDVASIEGYTDFKVSDDFTNWYYSYEKDGKNILNINGKDVASVESYVNFKVSNDFKTWYYSYEKDGKGILNINGKDIASVEGYTDFRVSKDGKTYGYVQSPKKYFDKSVFGMGMEKTPDKRTEEEKQYHLYINGEKIFSSSESISFTLLPNNSYYIEEVYPNTKKILYINGKKVLESEKEISIGEHTFSENGENYYYTYKKDGYTILNINGQDINKINGDVGVSVSKDFKNYYYIIRNGDKNTFNINGSNVATFEGNSYVFGIDDDYINWYYINEGDEKYIVNVNGKKIAEISSRNIWDGIGISSGYKGYSYLQLGEENTIYYNSIDTKYLNEPKIEVNVSQTTRKDIYKKIDSLLPKIYKKIDILGQEEANKRYVKIVKKVDSILEKNKNHKLKDILLYIQKKFQEKIK